MTTLLTSDTVDCSSTLGELGLKTHRLISRSLAAGLYDEAQQLLYINDHFLAVWAKANEAARRAAIEQQEEGYTRYIWRTSGDNRVRSSHAANNGRVFAWDSPPPTGHPGEDYGCRCRAEPYKPGESEYAGQTMASSINDSGYKWSDVDFTRHFYLGNGRGVTLAETGHLGGIINYYFYRLGKYNDVNAQIIEAARRHTGEFGYPFDSAYEFRDYLFVFGGGTVSGLFTGSVRHENGMMYVEGSIEYFYDDTFTDPIDARELLRETSDPDDATELQVRISDLGGRYFPIRDYWKATFRAEARADRRSSIYQWPK